MGKELVSRPRSSMPYGLTSQTNTSNRFVDPQQANTGLGYRVNSRLSAIIPDDFNWYPYCCTSDLLYSTWHRFFIKSDGNAWELFLDFFMSRGFPPDPTPQVLWRQMPRWVKQGWTDAAWCMLAFHPHSRAGLAFMVVLNNSYPQEHPFYHDTINWYFRGSLLIEHNLPTTYDATPSDYFCIPPNLPDPNPPSSPPTLPSSPMDWYLPSPNMCLPSPLVESVIMGEPTPRPTPVTDILSIRPYDDTKPEPETDPEPLHRPQPPLRQKRKRKQEELQVTGSPECSPAPLRPLLLIEDDEINPRGPIAHTFDAPAVALGINGTPPDSLLFSTSEFVPPPSYLQAASDIGAEVATSSRRPGRKIARLPSRHSYSSTSSTVATVTSSSGEISRTAVSSSSNSMVGRKRRLEDDYDAEVSGEDEL